MLVKCEQCNKEISRSPAQIQEHVFCSRKCWGSFRTASHTVTNVCKICGDKFQVAACYKNKFATCPRESCRKKNRKAIVQAMHASNVKGRKADCHPNRPHMAHGLCKECYDREWAKTNKEKVRETKKRWRRSNPDKVRVSHRKHLYKVDDATIKKRLLEQEGLCAICRQKPATDLDHDHQTGQSRGLLCGNCNRALGLFRENAEVLLGAIQYLDKWKNEVSKS